MDVRREQGHKTQSRHVVVVVGGPVGDKAVTDVRRRVDVNFRKTNKKIPKVLLVAVERA